MEAWLVGFDLRGKGILSQRAHAVVSQGINHNPGKIIPADFCSRLLSGQHEFGAGKPSATMVYGVDWLGQDSPRRRFSGSLYEIRMSGCLLFLQPALSS